MCSADIAVRVQGEFACFTRPEHKVERVSYPIMTPSAARGVLEAIYWHPQFTWRVLRIHVHAPVRTYALTRNEVNKKTPMAGNDYYFADEDRAQRHSVCLRDVDYTIVARPITVGEPIELAAKHADIFRRRVRRGQCYFRPALGTREFAAEFRPADDAPPPVGWTEDLGLMLWDIDYSSGKPPYQPLFFAAQVANGIMCIPGKPIGRQT